MQENKYEVVIIGSGVAGLTAAIYLKRSGINCLLIEGEIPGGQVVKTSIVTNYPGFNSISGPDLINSILNQVRELNVDILYKKVTGIKLEQNLKKVIIDEEEIVTNNIIIATGRTPKKLGLPNEEKLLGRGISYCATCDGVLFKNKEVVIVGGGDSALEEAAYLASLCKKVTIINRSNSFRAKSYLQDNLKYCDNIEIIKEAIVTDLLEENNVLKAVRINTDEKVENIPVDGCFIFIGYHPETKIFENLSITNDEGYIITNDNMETSIKGIYAAGDTRKKQVCQIVTATNDGAIAAINILKSLN